MSGKTWYVYCIPPIDFGWDLQQTVSSVIARMSGAESPEEEDRLDAFVTDFGQAWRVAGEAGMETPLRVPAMTFFLPDELEFEYGFSFKEDNNGTTYIVSPRLLGWLEAVADGPASQYVVSGRGHARCWRAAKLDVFWRASDGSK